MNLRLDFFGKKTWLLIFIFCFIYWTYLIFNTKMLIVFDSIGYENTGKLIYQNGWLDFFRTGPQRVPLYPALIALSMACADFLSTDYQLILKVFQVAFLFSTQILLITILRKLDVREKVIMIAALYFGISPATINATFSIFSEIVVFPFVAAAVLLAGSLWSDIHQKRKYRLILGKTILFSACFILLVFGRDAFEYIFYFFILPFSISAFFAFFNRRGETLRRLLVFISMAFIIFYSAISYVKTMNLRYNGNYVLCASRHSGIFLGSAYKRSQPVTFRIVASHIALIPGMGICRMFFSQQECDYAAWHGTDYWTAEAKKGMSAIPADRLEQEDIRLALDKIIDHPFQYLFFSFAEALKMPFWESTQIGYVGYPEFLTKVYNHPFVRFGLRLFFGLITIAAFVFVTFNLWRVKRQCFTIEDDQQNTIMLFFVWLMITTHTFLYALCSILTRYALPIVSMYIVCISITINAIIHRKLVNDKY